MSFHTDYKKWMLKSKRENCPVCNSEPMPDGMIDLYELKYTWLNSEPIECIKGACHVTSKIHVVELFELSDSDLLGIMKEVSLYAKALKTVTNAVKINYEIHGNTLPHLHFHLYPRYLDDPYPGQPINYNNKIEKLYTEGEYEEFVRKMRDEITSLLKH